jgi:hypothetical protein
MIPEDLFPMCRGVCSLAGSRFLHRSSAQDDCNPDECRFDTKAPRVAAGPQNTLRWRVSINSALCTVRSLQAIEDLNRSARRWCYAVDILPVQQLGHRCSVRETTMAGEAEIQARPVIIGRATIRLWRPGVA